LLAVVRTAYAEELFGAEFSDYWLAPTSPYDHCSQRAGFRIGRVSALEKGRKTSAAYS